MSPAEPAGFRRIGERERLAGFFFTHVTGTFVDPEGFTFEREIVRHPGAVCIAAIEADARHVIFVRQYRAALDTNLLELPAGKRDSPGEPPELCARRELAEEVGVLAGRITELGRFFNSPGFTDEETICYLAEELHTTTREAHGVEEHHLTIERVDLATLDALMADGVLVDGKSIICCLLVRDELARRSAASLAALAADAQGGRESLFDAVAPDAPTTAGPHASTPDRGAGPS